MDYRSPPIRRLSSGKQNPEIIQPLNRSEAIRRILAEHGTDLEISDIKNYLLEQDYMLPKDRTIGKVKKQYIQGKMSKVAKTKLQLAIALRKVVRLAGSSEKAVELIKRMKA